VFATGEHRLNFLNRARVVGFRGRYIDNGHGPTVSKWRVAAPSSECDNVVSRIAQAPRDFRRRQGFGETDADKGSHRAARRRRAILIDL
jgi:hypothetical protein